MSGPLPKQKFSPFLALVCAVFLFWLYAGYLGSGYQNVCGASRLFDSASKSSLFSRRSHPPSPVSFDVLQTPDGIELEYVGFHPGSNSAIAEVSIKLDGYRSLRGLWAPTVEHRNYPLMFVEWQPLSDDDKRVIRTRLVESLQQLGYPASNPWLQSVARGEESSDQILPRGYVHNSISLLWLAAIAYLVRLCWVGFVERRRGMRLGNNICPYCKYSLDGLTRGRCPECGRDWSA